MSNGSASQHVHSGTKEGMEFADLFAISSVWMVTWRPLRRAHHDWSRAGPWRVVVEAAFGEGNRCKDDMKFGVVEVLSATGILRDNPCVIRRSGASSTNSEQYRIRYYLHSSIRGSWMPRKRFKRVMEKDRQTRLDSQRFFKSDQSTQNVRA